MAYMKKEDGSVFNVSICVISNHMTRDTIAVHAFLRPVLSYVKEINPVLKKNFIGLTEQLVSTKIRKFRKFMLP